MADTTDAQKEILKKYISKLQNPDQVKQGLMADSDLGSSVMDTPAQRAMYNAQHDQNMSPENMVTGMGMPAIGMIKQGNVIFADKGLEEAANTLKNSNYAKPPEPNHQQIWLVKRLN